MNWSHILSALNYIMGSLFIIYLAASPGDFAHPRDYFSVALFVWSARFYSQRGEILSPVWGILVAIYYMVYLDDGMALGGFVLVVMILILKRFHNQINQQSLLGQLINVTGLFVVLMGLRKLIFVFFFMPAPSTAHLVIQSVIFMVFYGILLLIADRAWRKARGRA